MRASGSQQTSPALTLLPAAISATAIVFVFSIPWLAGRLDGRRAHEHPGRVRLLLARAMSALLDGVREATRLLRSRNAAVIAGSLGYWAFDNAVLWACFKGLGQDVPLIVVLLAYLLGQLGGILPLPAGSAASTAGLSARSSSTAPRSPRLPRRSFYRLILFWVPLIIGGIAFIGLRRGLNDPARPDLCAVPARA